MTIDRRGFLGGVVGGVLGAVLPGRDLSAADQAARKWKPSMNSGFDKSLPFAEAVGMIREVGFEVMSLGDPAYSGYDTPQGLELIEKLMLKHGLKVDWIHAPTPRGDQLFSIDEETRQKSLGHCRSAIDAAQVLGVSAVTLHLILPYDIPHGDRRDQMIVRGMESLKELEGYAGKKRVKLALENGQRKDYDEVLMKCLDHFSSETIGLTYDTGHENVKQPGFEVLEKYGSRLEILHIHDNTGRDTHQLPFEGTIDWQRFAEVLRGCKTYPGNLGLEVSTGRSEFKGDPRRFLVEAKERIERIASSL